MNSNAKKSRFTPTVVGIIGVLTSLLMAGIELQHERMEAAEQFSRFALLQLESVRTRVDAAVDEIRLLSAHLENSQTDLRSRTAFAAYANSARQNRAYIQALEWIPRVPASARETYEKSAQADGYANFSFLAANGSSGMAREADKAEYFPVYFVEPFKGNERALGFDLGSNPVRRQALEECLRLDQVVATSRVRLVQEKGNQSGILVFAPVHTRDSNPRAPLVSGFALGVLRMSDLISSGSDAPGHDANHIVLLQVFDVSAPAAEQQLYPASTGNGAAYDPSSRDLREVTKITVGGRTWQLVASPGAGYKAVSSWTSPAFVLLLGLLITAICVNYLAFVAASERGSAATAEELTHMNRALRARSRVNQALTSATDEQTLYEKACSVITQEGGYPLAWIGTPEKDEAKSITVIASSGRGSSYLANLQITWGDGPLGQGPTGTAFRDKNTVMIEDLMSDPFYQPWSHLAREFGLCSAVSVPLIIDDEAVSALTVYASADSPNGQRAFKEEEARLIIELAKDLCFGIETIRRRKTAEEEHKQRRQLESQLQQSQRLEAIGRLAGGIAHDFNNLLMVIMAHTDLLMQDLPETLAERANSIMKSASRAAELTGQLLAFSRKQVVQPVVLTLNQILDGMTDMLPTMLREDIEVQIERCAEPWQTRVDRNQFERVLMNLAVNARDAMPKGGRLAIKTNNSVVELGKGLYPDWMQPGRYALLSISDTGTGMTEETRKRVFEPFYTTKQPGKGTGLGLSMVYGIVKRAGGYITVSSNLGRGTTFDIYLPVVDDAPSSETAAPATVVQPRVKSATVLLVEDDNNLRTAISDFLRSGGHKVVAAGCVEDAMQAVDDAQDGISLVLTDVVLKGGSGPQVVQYMAERNLHFKTIFMSGYTNDAIEHHGVLSEDLHFLQKPFSRATLMTKINEVLTTVH